MGLRENANSHYSLSGVIQTFEDCARIIDNRVEKDKRKWRTKQLSLCAEYDRLKLFPWPAEHILADKLAESRHLSNQLPTSTSSLLPKTMRPIQTETVTTRPLSLLSLLEPKLQFYPSICGHKPQPSPFANSPPVQYDPLRRECWNSTAGRRYHPQ